MTDPFEARDIAARLLRDVLPRRWNHVRGVAGRARVAFGDEVVESAAWLHDIGYSPSLVVTGFHPVDGARWLRSQRMDEALVSLVAHHSCAFVEARLRGFDRTFLDEFPKDPSLPHDELCFCDLTTGPDGELVTCVERIAEIRRRYPDGHIVRAFVDRAEGDLLATVARVEGALAVCTPSQSR